MMSKKKFFFKRNQITFVFLIVFMVYVSVTFVRQEIKLRELKFDESNLVAEIQMLNSDIIKLEEEIEATQGLTYVEKLAREKLKMVKPNEIIYIIQEPKE